MRYTDVVVRIAGVWLSSDCASNCNTCVRVVLDLKKLRSSIVFMARDFWTVTEQFGATNLTF